MSKQPTDEEIRVLLNGQTAEITWQELEKHFARGVVLKVAENLDLIDVGSAMIRDDADTLKTWTDEGLVDHVNIDDAKRWSQEKASFWAVVVAPWVLIQAK